MTCIAGLVHNGAVYLGGDSAGVAGSSLTRRADVKVFRNGDFVFGFTSSFRMGQLLHHAFAPPVPKAGEDLERFMSTRFVDAVRECLKKGGFAREVNDRELGGTFLVGYKDRLFCIASDYQVGETLDQYDAVGAGEDIAKGALYVLHGADIHPEDKLRIALEAAERWSGAVCAPFHFVSTERKKQLAPRKAVASRRKKR